MNCYILTGGRSTRMGQSKTALFLDRISAAATAAFDRVIAVQRHNMERLRIETIFEEPHEVEAPVFGVVRALEHCDARCVILATDYPLITTALLRDLRSRFESSGAPLFMPVWRGAPQPLCAGYSADLLPILRRRISEGKLDLRGLLDEVPAATVEIEGNELLNVNTPAEMEEAERLR
ncbi:MAG TPA: molybdenum cofactor guanylyltransferase [Thermoanaerobaculia bacterium]